MESAWQQLWNLYQQLVRRPPQWLDLIRGASWGDRGLLGLLGVMFLVCLLAFMGGAHMAFFGVLALLGLIAWMLQVTREHQGHGQESEGLPDPRYASFAKSLSEQDYSAQKIESLLPTARLHLVQARARSRRGTRLLGAAVSLLLVFLGLAAADSVGAGLSHALVLWLMVALPLIYFWDYMTCPVSELEELERFMQLYCEAHSEEA